ncbi:MAG: hypothetical protein UT39_C0004G0007 [Candidatus Woesebacteria bacterium GW2011_GWA1_39_21]|uniref:Prepilin-type N-terminal cleavage/methylation domain-containing protein n=1 Tax=Candidatus Woesebacteria bacterium GW2011_GWA1_39_21 TaxID=1618550 RepID=A0A0G0N895_9BACT|nr:MAG: hypothetical protein UT39_C0004G0007 [Candidatus Woesebacteria bacterium GW2011_GWA1_39_21]
MKNYKQTQGVTIIELLIAIAITSIIGLGIVALQYILGQNQIAITTSYKSIEDANYASSMISKELRRASQSETGSYLLSNASDQNIVFYSDYDLDGRIERVQYQLVGTTLTKTITKPTGTPVTYSTDTTNTTISDIIRNGSDPLFYYYNENYPTDTENNPLPANQRLSDTRSIGIHLKVNTNANDNTKDYVVDSFINIRMLKDNL